MAMVKELDKLMAWLYLSWNNKPGAPHKSAPAVPTASLWKLCKTLMFKINYFTYYSPWGFPCFLMREELGYKAVFLLKI